LTAWRSLGVIPTGLLAALVGSGLWMLTDWTGTQLSARAISYLVLVSIAFVLAAAGSWKQVRAALGREGPRAT
jgi:putative flippase GtrA